MLAFIGCSHAPVVHDIYVNPFTKLALQKTGPTAPSHQLPPKKTTSCESPPKAPIKMQTTSRYIPNSVGWAVSNDFYLNEELRTTAPYRDYLDQLVDWADENWQRTEGSTEARKCLRLWLEAWAKDNAMLFDANDDGIYERKWMLSGLSLLILRTESRHPGELVNSPEILKWLRNLADQVKQDFDPPRRKSRRNNHLYWAAVGVMGSAIILGDRDLYDWSHQKFKMGLDQVDRKGFLPLELERAHRARHYHAFALQPLVMAAFMALPNGQDFYTYNGDALHRLSKVTAEGFDSPEIFKAQNGHTQEKPRWHDTKWLEIYNYQFPENVKPHWLKRFRPGHERWLGGNLTETFMPTKPATSSGHHE